MIIIFPFRHILKAKGHYRASHTNMACNTKTSLAFIWLVGLLIASNICQGQRTITIDGGWSPWSTVATSCLRENLKGHLVPVTCGGGKMTRIRSCTNPVPQVRHTVKSEIKAAPNYKPLPIIDRTKLPNLYNISRSLL